MSDHKVLIVEDSLTMGRVLSYLLRQQLGFTPMIATSLAETRTYLDSCDPAEHVAAIVDLNLPDAPNGEAVDVVMDKGLPVVVLSGLVDPQTRRQLLDKGVVDYLNKEGRYAYEYAVKLVKRLALNPDIKALIVEDSRVSRGLMVSLLRQFNLEAMEATNGVQALEILKQHPDIQLMVTDYHMDRMDGFELTTKVRQQYSPEELVIIGVSSAEDTGELSAKFIKSGANDFLHKPFSSEEFHCRIMQNLELNEIIGQLHLAATTDELTGLFNRRSFFEQGNKQMLQCRKEAKPLTVAQLDLDFFKSINDQYGHEAGDRVLQAFAKLAQRYFDQALFARMGGEEFALLLPDCDIDRAYAQLEGFRQQVETLPVEYGDITLQLSCSIGLSEQGETLDDLLRHADDALYQAKHEGRNRVCWTAESVTE